MMSLELNSKKLSKVIILVLLTMALPTVGANGCEDAHIGNWVWNDLNKNGIQDPGEPGIREVTVNLYDCAGNPIGNTITDVNGWYQFKVPAGVYKVEFILPSGMVFSPQDQGGDDALDSDANPSTGMTQCTTLEPFEYDWTWDAGMYCTPPGTGTPGYWKNHPEAWPVDEITIGGKPYTKEQAIEFMQTPEKGDKTYTMFRALVSAKLNVLIGNDNSCIAETIDDAELWMENKPVSSNIRAKSDDWKDGEPLYEKLDDYNNGKLCCAFPRD